MSIETLYFQTWQQLINCKQQNRLPHALLFVGPSPQKKEFSLHLAHYLLCKEESAPCGRCHSCCLFQANVHPDLLFIEPTESGGQIKIDRIRELVQFVNETALQSSLRIVILHPAFAMNHYAANALLKTLEEPAPNTILILINDSSLGLLKTITSRCQKFFFPLTEIPSENERGKLREEVNKSFHLLKEQKADPLQVAEKFLEEDILILLNLMIECLLEQLRNDFRNNKILNFLDHIQKIRGYISSAIHLNRQLLLEELFIRWSQYASC